MNSSTPTFLKVRLPLRVKHAAAALAVVVSQPLAAADSATSISQFLENQRPSLGQLLQTNQHDFLSSMGDTSANSSAYSPEVGNAAYAKSYYGRVDPQGKRATLDKWLAENGFKDPDAQVQSAEYINASDLGFGRQMFCFDNGRTSCYVQNYLDPEGASRFAATVAMERMSNSAGSFVAFFVYDAAGKRINQIPLDNEGAKTVPESCWACHGGGERNDSFVGGNYLPFDVNNLADWPNHLTRAAQGAKFRALNAIVYKDAKNTAKNSAMTNLIEAWYGGAPSGSRSFVAAKPPSSWYTDAAGLNSESPSVRNQYKVEQSLYTDVYGRYCRMCHVAQQVDWQQAKGRDFAIAAFNHICRKGGATPVMPHAEVTYNDFFSDARYFAPRLETSDTANTTSLARAVAASGSSSSSSSGASTLADRLAQVVASRSTLAAASSTSTASTSAASSAAVARGTITSTASSTATGTASSSSSSSGVPAAVQSVSRAVAAAPVEKFTAFELLCNELPLNVPTGSAVLGNTMFTGKGCSGCHTLGTPTTASFGGDLACHGGKLRQDMGSLNAAMGSIKLTPAEIGHLSARLNRDCP